MLIRHAIFEYKMQGCIQEGYLSRVSMKDKDALTLRDGSELADGLRIIEVFNNKHGIIISLTQLSSLII